MMAKPERCCRSRCRCRYRQAALRHPSSSLLRLPSIWLTWRRAWTAGKAERCRGRSSQIRVSQVTTAIICVALGDLLRREASAERKHASGLGSRQGRPAGPERAKTSTCSRSPASATPERRPPPSPRSPVSSCHTTGPSPSVEPPLSGPPHRISRTCRAPELQGQAPESVLSCFHVLSSKHQRISFLIGCAEQWRWRHWRQEGEGRRALAMAAKSFSSTER